MLCVCSILSNSLISSAVDDDSLFVGWIIEARVRVAPTAPAGVGWKGFGVGTRRLLQAAGLNVTED